MLLRPYAKLGGVTNLILLYFLNISYLVSYFRYLHYESHVMTDQLSFDDFIGQVCFFLLILLCKLTHFYRRVLIVYNAVNVEEGIFINVIEVFCNSFTVLYFTVMSWPQLIHL